MAMFRSVKSSNDRIKIWPPFNLELHLWWSRVYLFPSFCVSVDFQEGEFDFVDWEVYWLFGKITFRTIRPRKTSGAGFTSKGN